MRRNINIIKLIVYTSLKAVFAVLTKILFRTRVEGADNLPKKAPFIIAANHSSFADAALVALSVPFMIRWITRQDVYNEWYLNPFHKILGSIVANGSVEKALGALGEGDVVGIFPEGTRTENGRLGKADVGIAVLALKSASPVVPIGISGIFKAYGRHLRFPRPHPVLVKIGRPISFPEINIDFIEESTLRKTTDDVMSRIGDLSVDI